MRHLGRRARRRPDAIAVIEDGGRTVACADLAAATRP
ncbi:hypothetical protein HNR21_004260 [Actinomadura cellulosilytica]|uniref:Uncharacterized protein n=1 Tax=Thermomonospora cellulosilytica TaxID=1411118 RepID=A0A7W3N0N3_9ACTN|nr:hypothetical protein [Thermomonospora cellulosilytica]